MSDEVLSRLDALASMVAKLGPASTPAVSVTHLWEVFALANRERLRSWRDYAQRWRDHVGPAFGERNAPEVSPADVDAYRARRRAEGAAIATVNREIALLRRLLNFGVRRGELARSQLHGPGMTSELIHPEDNVRTTIIEEDPSASTLTLDDLLAAADVRLRAMIVLLHHTGLRRGEASRLRWDRIRGEVAWVPSKDTKGGYGGRVVPLSSKVLAALAALPRDSPWVFPSRHLGVKKAQPITPDWWTRWFGRLVRKLGLDGPDGGPPWLHDLRRSFVTLARRDGEAERAIMNISGHKTRAVFDRYDVHDLRDVLAFRERREAARSARLGPRKGPHRVTPDHHAEEKQELRENLVDSKSARA